MPKIGPISIELNKKQFGEKPKKVKTGELGGSGTTVYGGVISNVEYNSKLNTEYGQGGLELYDQMRRSDPIIKQSTLIITLPIIQAEWNIQEADDESEAETHANFIKDALFERMNRSFKDTLREILTYLPFGFSVFEKVFKIEDNAVYLKKLAYRAQKSIMKFEMSDHKPGITQAITTPQTKQVDIPIQKLVVFTNEKEGENWRGISIYRSAYKPWYYKDKFEKISAIGFERHAVGVPVFKMPTNPSPTDVDKAEEIGKNLRANEKAYVLLPHGWEMEIQKGETSIEESDTAIRRLNREMLSNVLAQFLDLGSGSTGSRALSSDHSDAFFKSIQAHADYIAEIFNDHIIPQLIDLNFNNVMKYPTLKATGIQKIDIAKVSKAIVDYTDKGLLHGSIDLENFLRKTLSLPELSEDDIKKIEKDDLEGNSEDQPQDKNGKNQSKKQEKENEDDKNERVEKMTETTCGHDHAMKFGEHSFFRAMTFAEEKIDFKRIQRTLDIIEARFSTDLREILNADIDQMIAKIRIALREKDIAGIERLFTEFSLSMRSALIKQQREAFEYGKRTASDTLSVSLMATDQDEINLMRVRADAINQRLSNDIVTNAKLSAISHMTLDTDPVKAVEKIAKQAKQIANTKADLTASQVLMGGFNQGRNAVFKEHSDKIHGLQRSELLDNKVCNYCLSIDGRVITVDDPFGNTDQFHFRCRGIWVEIGIEEEEKPEITGVPEELKKRVGSLNEFKQMKKAMPLKGSLAENFVNARS